MCTGRDVGRNLEICRDIDNLEILCKPVHIVDMSDGDACEKIILIADACAYQKLAASLLKRFRVQVCLSRNGGDLVFVRLELAQKLPE